MLLKVENILIFVFIISLRVTEELDFCESFVENDNKIDYGYQHRLDGYYFFIDSNYWRLEHNQKTFKLLEGSGSVPQMDKNYLFAMNFKVCENSTTSCEKYNWMTGLYKDAPINKTEWPTVVFDDSSTHIRLIKLIADDSGLLSVNEDPTLLPLTFRRQLDIKPTIGFQLLHPILCLLQQTSNESVTYYRTYRCFKFTEGYQTGKGFVNRTAAFEDDKTVIQNLKEVMNSSNVSYGSDQSILNDIEDKHQVIAIFSTDNEYVFFHKHHKRINYCFSSGQLFNKGCSTTETEPNILIDCTRKAPTGETTTQTSESGSPIVWILLIIIILIIIIIIIIFVVYKFVGSKQKDDKNAPKNDTQKPNESNSSAPKEPVAAKPSLTPDKEESIKELPSVRSQI